MDKLIFLTQYISILSIFLLLTCITGYRIINLIGCSFHSTCEKILYSLTVGIGAWSYIVFFVGLIGAINIYTFGLIAALIVLLNYKIIIEFFSKLRNLWIIALIFLLCLPTFIISLYPPIDGDSVSYHLAIAKQYQQTGFIRPGIYQRYAVFPQFIDVLFTLMMTCFDGTSTQLISFCMMFLTCLSLYLFCKRFYSINTGILSVAILLSSPLILYFGSVSYIDEGLMFFTFMTIYSLLIWTTSRNKKWLIMTAILLGLTVGIKYSGLALLAVISLIVFYLLYREYKYKTFGFFIMLTLTIASPWYIYNFYFTRNPVFPFCSNIFGYKWWNSTDLKYQIESIMYAYYYNSPDATSFISLLKLPFNLFFNSKLFGFPEISSFSKILIIFIPLIAVSWFKDMKVRFISTLIIIFTLIWFYTTQTIRYLMPIYPLFFVVTAASIILVLRRFFTKPVMAALLSVIIVIPGYNYSFGVVKNRKFPPTNEKSKIEYTSSIYPSYKIYRMLNNLNGKNYTVYTYDDCVQYYVDGLIMGDCFGPARSSLIENNLDKENVLYEGLKSLGVDYLVINTNVMTKFMNEYYYEDYEYYKRVFLKEYPKWNKIRLLYSHKNVFLFKLL